MPYTAETLIAKIREMYPAIGELGIEVVAWLDEGQGAWVVTLRKGEAQLTTYVDRDEVDACLEGDRCVNLGVHVAEFLANFEEAAHLRSAA
ncbi:MAG: hypothetical protein D6739_05155 [Nitrospirae bacterium]|nr:MAG: hypothetical protein D6739_05155 [Nitrospirota bacterium]